MALSVFQIIGRGAWAGSIARAKNRRWSFGRAATQSWTSHQSRELEAAAGGSPGRGEPSPGRIAKRKGRHDWTAPDPFFKPHLNFVSLTLTLTPLASARRRDLAILPLGSAGQLIVNLIFREAAFKQRYPTLRPSSSSISKMSNILRVVSTPSMLSPSGSVLLL